MYLFKLKFSLGIFFYTQMGRRLFIDELAHVSVEKGKEETWSRRGTEAVQSVSGSIAFPAGQRSGQFLPLVQMTLPYLATQSVSGSVGY